MAGLLPQREGGTIEISKRYSDLDRGMSVLLSGVSIRRISFGGRRVVVRHGGRSKLVGGQLPYADFKVVLDGVCDGDPKGDENAYVFKLATKDRKFDHPLQPKTCWGLGWGLYFNGTNAAVNFGSHSEHNLITEFSIRFPFYYEDLPGTTKTIVGRGVTDTDGWIVEFTTAGKLRLRTNQSGAHQDTVSIALESHVIHWPTIVYANNAVTMYLGSVVLDLDTVGVHINPASAGLRTLYLGRNNAGDEFMEMLVSELQVWAVALTKEEIGEIEGAALDPSEVTGNADLVLYARMDEGTLGNIGDSSDTGANGTTVNAQWVHSMTGSHEMAGEFIPDPYGPTYNFTPLQLDNNLLIYQLSGEEIDSFVAYDEDVPIGPVCEGGFPGIPLAASGNKTSLFDFLTTVSNPGTHINCIIAGGTFVKLRSRPTGKVTVNFLGNAPGGTYLETAGQQVRWIMCNRGADPLVDPDDLHTASFANIESVCPQAHQMLWENGESIADAINFALRSVGVVGFLTEDGQYKLKRVINPANESTPSITIHSYQVHDLRPLDRSKAIWRVQLFGDRNMTPMDRNDMLPGLENTEAEKFLMHEWRQQASPRTGVLHDFPDADPIELYTGLTNSTDLLAEAKRKCTLFGRPDQAFRFLYKEIGLAIERMDVVYFDYQVLDEKGNLVNAIGSAAMPYYVTEISEDEPSGGVWYTLWTPKPTT
jgi:hypothetical protein